VGSVAAWFETRGVAALLTMRVSDLILRSIAMRCVSKDEATEMFQANGRDGMKRARVAPLAIAVILGWALLNPADAAPPTATPSPGYDARLQEQRTNSARVYQPVARVGKRVPPRRAKRTPAH
jgi:hypothetical protein